MQIIDIQLHAVLQEAHFTKSFAITEEIGKLSFSAPSAPLRESNSGPIQGKERLPQRRRERRGETEIFHISYLYSIRYRLVL
jgi:hypothetical protein